MNLRLIESQWTPFVKTLCRREDVETAGVILAERLKGDQVLFAREMVPLPENGYLIRRADQLRIDPITLNRIIRPAREHGLSILTVHTHPGTKRPWFSAADDQGDARLMPSLLNQTSGPHGSMVIAGSSGLAAGRIWRDIGVPMDVEIRTVGKRLSMSADLPMIGDSSAWFDRQRLALGEDGERVLRKLHIVVVGLGGTGSVAFVQLAHLGVGRITVIDGDRVERSNVSRILGATTHDTGSAWKVDVAARYAQALGLGNEVHCLRGHLGKEVSPVEFEDADIVLSCVDKHLPRALMNRLSYEKALPLIDMGCAFRVDGNGRVVAGSGRVVIAGPGRPCLACWGHIDPNRIRVESLSPGDREREIADGYIDGADVAQPSVVSFNTTVAGAAVVELLRLVTGFAGSDAPPMGLSFDFQTGTVRRNRTAGMDECRICSRLMTAQDKLIVSSGEENQMLLSSH